MSLIRAHEISDEVEAQLRCRLSRTPRSSSTRTPKGWRSARLAFHGGSKRHEQRAQGAAADRCQPRHRPCDGQALQRCRAGGSSPARATRCRPSASATRTGPTISPPISATRPISSASSPRPAIFSTGRSTRLVNNAGVSPKTAVQRAARQPQRRARRLASGVSAQFFVPLTLSRGLRPGAGARQGCDRQHHLDRRPPGPSVRRLGLFDLEGGAVGADPRDGGRIRRARGARQRGGAGRDRDRDAVARDRGAAAAHSAPPARHPVRRRRRRSFSCAATTPAYVTGTEISVNGGQHIY